MKKPERERQSHLYVGTKKAEYIKAEIREVVARGQEGGRLVKRYKIRITWINKF